MSAECINEILWRLPWTWQTEVPWEALLGLWTYRHAGLSVRETFRWIAELESKKINPQVPKSQQKPQFRVLPNGSRTGHVGVAGKETFSTRWISSEFISMDSSMIRKHSQSYLLYSNEKPWHQGAKTCLMIMCPGNPFGVSPRSHTSCFGITCVGW